MATEDRTSPCSNKVKKDHVPTHPSWFNWASAIPAAITMLFCLMSLGGLYETWLEPFGLHIWMENVFTTSFSSFDRFSDDPVRYKVMFSWVTVVATASGFIVSLGISGFAFKHVAKHPQMYLLGAAFFLVMLFILLLTQHGPDDPSVGLSRSSRNLFYSGLYSFGIWGFVLSGSAYFAWSTLFCGIVLAVRQFLGYRDADGY